MPSSLILIYIPRNDDKAQNHNFMVLQAIRDEITFVAVLLIMNQ